MRQGRSTATRADGPEESPSRAAAARSRAALELIARHEPDLKRTARRFSLDAGDAEDAYQRALEIVLTKAPTTDPLELIRWTQTVTKHEALAVRRSRERLLGYQPREGDEGIRLDPLAAIPAGGDGPDEQIERREEIARSREALRALKPAELRALGLLAEGYSYAEIGQMTGFSQTKVNRLLAEGRSRFRDLTSKAEDGTRCRELRPLLSAFCDGETAPAAAETMREHLRACAHCRATARAYRGTPGLAIALAPVMLPARSLLGRLRDLLAQAGSQASAGAKLIAVCATGAAGCVATGILPVPLHSQATTTAVPAAERAAQVRVPIAGKAAPKPARRGHHGPGARRRHPRARGAAAESEPVEASVPVETPEYKSPPAAPPAAPEPVASAAPPEPSGSAAGEFGP